MALRKVEIKGHAVLGGVENFPMCKAQSYDASEHWKFMWFLD